MSSIIQEGALQMWNEKKKRWQQVHCKIHHSGWFYWFNKPSAKKPIHGVDLKEVSAYFAFGRMLQRLPIQSAGVNEQNIDRTFAVPHQPHRQTAITFFQCNDAAEMNTWIASIFSSLQQNFQIFQTPAPTAATSSNSPPAINQSPDSNSQTVSHPGLPMTAPYPIPSGPAPSPMPYYPQQFGTYPFPPSPPPPSPPPPSHIPYAMPPPLYGQNPGTAPAPPLNINPAINQGYSSHPVYMVPHNAMSEPQQMSLGHQMQQYQPTRVQVIPVAASSNATGSGWKTAAIGVASGMAGNVLANSLFGGGWGGGWGGYGWGGGYNRGQTGTNIIEENNFFNVENNYLNYENNVDLGNDSGIDFIDETNFDDFEL